MKMMISDLTRSETGKRQETPINIDGLTVPRAKDGIFAKERTILSIGGKIFDIPAYRGKPVMQWSWVTDTQIILRAGCMTRSEKQDGYPAHYATLVFDRETGNHKYSLDF